MIDFDKIGMRIKEQRKCILKVSQEKMAEELNMYQADIRNLEKAKSGSGITDLEKLDRIADFLKVSPEYLIFGSNRSMAKYNGSKMKLKRSKSKISKSRLDILQDRIGSEADISKVRSITYECGDYLIVTLCEDQLELDHESKQMVLSLMRFHTYIFLGDEIIAVMVADPTTVMQHVYQPSFQHLCEAIPSEVLQPADFYRILTLTSLFIYSVMIMNRENCTEQKCSREWMLYEKPDRTGLYFMLKVYMFAKTAAEMVF